jgi:hypothetical protein
MINCRCPYANRKRSSPSVRTPAQSTALPSPQQKHWRSEAMCWHTAGRNVPAEEHPWSTRMCFRNKFAGCFGACAKPEFPWSPAAIPYTKTITMGAPTISPTRPACCCTPLPSGTARSQACREETKSTFLVKQQVMHFTKWVNESNPGVTSIFVPSPEPFLLGMHCTRLR